MGPWALWQHSNLSNWEFNQHQLHWSVIDICRQAKQPSPIITSTIGVVDTPLYPLCNAEEETSLHFLGACDALAEARGLIFGIRYFDTEDIKGLALWDLLRFIKTSKRSP